MELLIVLATFTISLVTGLFVYQKNPKSGTNVYFSLLVFFISAYPVFNYFAVNSTSDAQAFTWAKMILLVSIPQGPLLYFFARTFPNTIFIFNKKRQILIICWVMLNIIFAFSGLIFKSVTVANNKVSIQPGPLVPSFGLLHFSTIVAGLYVLNKKFRHSFGASKRQLFYIFYGIFASFTIMFLITFILPIFLNSTFLLAISPVVLTSAVISVAYAIVSEHLFDIRATVALSVGYVLLISTIIGLYALGVFGVVNVLFSNADQEFLRQIFQVALIIPLAISFQSIKKFFDKITNRLFYRDAYDTQTVIDQLGRILVAEIDLKIITKNTSDIIKNSIKSTFIEFVLFRKEGKFEREGDSYIHDGDVHKLVQIIKSNHKDTVLISELTNSNPVFEIMRNNNINVLLRLKTQHQVVGYIAFGEKKNGNIYSNQDLKLLTIVSHELAVAIQNALRFEEIQQFNITLQDKVDIATKQLRHANDRLKALDETKDEFISMASHQLRTPLTSVKGYVSMVLEGDAGKITDSQRKLLDQSFLSAQRMVYLIADLLNVSRLRTGKFVIDAAPTNLADLVEGELQQLTETAKSRGLELSYEKPKDFPSIMLDETKTRQVIMNFADNAIYYTPSGGHIKVNVIEKPDSVEFTVVDDGIGVPKALQHHLFTKFYRADNAKKARPDGTGLGLFMAKKVIVAQGGALIFHSEEGKGSTFGFSFPKEKLKVPEHIKTDGSKKPEAKKEPTLV